jgi:signal transduction histidine kinase
VLLSEIASHFTYQAREKGTALEVSAPDACMIVSDREMLTIIFQNLISNALKYAPRGTIRVLGEAQPDGSCLVRIKDEGPGIPPDKLAQLFTAFTRGQTYGQPGVGLGLSIARQAADLIGARIWAESQPGDGCTFFVQIPKEVAAKPS